MEGIPPLVNGRMLWENKEGGFSGFLFVIFCGWFVTSGPFYSNFYYFMVCDHSLALSDKVTAWRKIVLGTPIDMGKNTTTRQTANRVVCLAFHK